MELANTFEQKFKNGYAGHEQFWTLLKNVQIQDNWKISYRYERNQTTTSQGENC